MLLLKSFYLDHKEHVVLGAGSTNSNFKVEQSKGLLSLGMNPWNLKTAV